MADPERQILPDDQHELVPLAEPDEHGNVHAPVPPAPVQPTVVTERYGGPATSGGGVDAAGEPVDEPLIVNPGFPGANTLIVAGGLLTVTAIFLAGYYAPKYPIAHSLSALYDIAVHTGTGLVAVLIASIFTERRFNNPKLAAARMYMMVATLYAIRFSPIPIPTSIDQWILGLAAYVLLLMGLFRLPQRDLGIIGITHFGLWLIVKLGASLEAFVAGATAVPG